MLINPSFALLYSASTKCVLIKRSPYDTTCIAKGKAHKKFEFGNKVGLMVNPKNLVIQAIACYDDNAHDSKTTGPLLNQALKNLRYAPEEVIYERAGRGQKQINQTIIYTLGKSLSQTIHIKGKRKERSLASCRSLKAKI